MSSESDLRLEEKLDGHIARHEQDYKTLLWWIIGTLIALLGSSTTGFISIGKTQEQVNQLSIQQQDKVSRIELQGIVNLFNEKFSNIDGKLNDIKRGLNIK